MDRSNRISILISTRDRSTELALLLSSLLSQTYQDFDIVIVDGSQPRPVLGTHFVQSIINRLKLQGHGVKMTVIGLPGVCPARQAAIDADHWDNAFCCRLDDDVILQPDYLEQLMKGIAKGYDMMSGVTLHCASPIVMRETRFVKPIINKITINENGPAMIGDDCGFAYDTPAIIPADHFRSCVLYRSSLHKKHGVDYRLGLSNVGFREETFISIKAILAGFKIGVNTAAVNWHLQTPSGGCRFPDYNQLVGMDNYRFDTWFKRKLAEHGDFIEKYHSEVIKLCE